MAFNPSQLKSFSHFINNWQSKQESLLQELDSILSPDIIVIEECDKIIPRVLSHYQQFYQEKSTAAAEDVFLLLSPPWLSSFERSLLWVSGFRPSILFTLLERSVETSYPLSREQELRIAACKMETRRREREITQAMARVQETIAEPPLYDSVKKFARLVDGERSDFEEAMESLKRAMRAVVAEADALRCRKADELVRILNPVQGVRFLAAAARFELRAKKLGMEKDAERNGAGAGVGSSSQIHG